VRAALAGPLSQKWLEVPYNNRSCQCSVRSRKAKCQNHPEHTVVSREVFLCVRAVLLDFLP
jgi:hypothetical protein